MIDLPFVKSDFFRLNDDSIVLDFKPLFINSYYLVSNYQLPSAIMHLNNGLISAETREDIVPSQLLRTIFSSFITYFKENVFEEIYEYNIEEDSELKKIEFIDICNYISSFKIFLASISERIKDFFDPIEPFKLDERFYQPIINDIEEIKDYYKGFDILYEFFNIYDIIRKFDIRKLHKPKKDITYNQFLGLLNELILFLDKLFVKFIIVTTCEKGIKYSKNKNGHLVIHYDDLTTLSKSYKTLGIYRDIYNIKNLKICKSFI